MATVGDFMETSFKQIKKIDTLARIAPDFPTVSLIAGTRFL